MEAQQCTGCGEPIAIDVLSCPTCGQPIAPPANKKAGPIISLIGALFVVVGPFLPWLIYEIETVNGVDETKKQALIFVGLGVFAAMFSLSALTGKKFTGIRGNTLAGIVACALAGYFYYELRDLVGVDGPQLGSGLYFCLVGSALVLVGGILTISRRDKLADNSSISL